MTATDRAVPGSPVWSHLAEFRELFEDEARFRVWHDAAARRLYGYLFGRCGGDVSLTEDLTQQAFLQAVRSRDSFDGRSDPITWLIAIGRNVLLDHIRRMDRQERLGLRLIVREIATGEADGQLPSHDEREDILAALRQLPARQRAALLLHHVDGLPVREVARALGRSEGAVEQLLHRGRDGFRRLYEEASRG